MFRDPGERLLRLLRRPVRRSAGPDQRCPATAAAVAELPQHLRPAVGNMHAKNGDGSWTPWEGATSTGQGCVESNPYQQGWFVPHDVAGLIDLMGQDYFLTPSDRVLRQDAADLQMERLLQPCQRAGPSRALSVRLCRRAVADAEMGALHHGPCLRRRREGPLRQRGCRPDVRVVYPQRDWAFIRSRRWMAST